MGFGHMDYKHTHTMNREMNTTKPYVKSWEEGRFVPYWP